jgi:hypothetical protein
MGLMVIAKQQTFRHKIKIFRKNRKSCDIVSEKKIVLQSESNQRPSRP